MPQPASSTPHSLPGTSPRITVGVADLQATADRGTRVITHALGSCIGVTAWDPRTHATAMLHYMLPESKVSPEKAEHQPAMFGDLGVPLLIEKMKALGGPAWKVSDRVLRDESLQWNETNGRQGIWRRKTRTLWHLLLIIMWQCP